MGNPFSHGFPSSKDMEVLPMIVNNSSPEHNLRVKTESYNPTERPCKLTGRSSFCCSTALSGARSAKDDLPQKPSLLCSCDGQMYFIDRKLGSHTITPSFRNWVIPLPPLSSTISPLEIHRWQGKRMPNPPGAVTTILEQYHSSSARRKKGSFSTLRNSNLPKSTLVETV